MPFMLRVVMVRVGRGGCGSIGGGDREFIVMDVLIEEVGDDDCWLIKGSGWSIVTVGVGGLCATGGDI